MSTRLYLRPGRGHGCGVWPRRFCWHQVERVISGHVRSASSEALSHHHGYGRPQPNQPKNWITPAASCRAKASPTFPEPANAIRAAAHQNAVTLGPACIPVHRVRCDGSANQSGFWWAAARPTSACSHAAQLALAHPTGIVANRVGGFLNTSRNITKECRSRPGSANSGTARYWNWINDRPGNRAVPWGLAGRCRP